MSGRHTYPRLQHLFGLSRLGKKGEKRLTGQSKGKCTLNDREMVEITDYVPECVIDSEKDADDVRKGIDRKEP